VGCEDVVGEITFPGLLLGVGLELSLCSLLSSEFSSLSVFGLASEVLSFSSHTKSKIDP